MGNWFRNTMAKISTAYQRFMQGRYGGDKLNITLIWIAFAVCIINLLIPFKVVKLFLLVFYYGLLGWAIFRFLSRDTYKRYQENRVFLQMLDRAKDREHRYYNCPRCRQPVRVPRGKGKISITCPKCKEKFIKKT